MNPRILLALLASLRAICPLRAEDLHPTGRAIYAAPAGKADGDGTAEKPLDLVTALSARSPARPGDTILLVAGTYEGEIKEGMYVPFPVNVSGEEGKPILVMPVPGAAVQINGYLEINSTHLRIFNLEIGNPNYVIDGIRYPPVVNLMNSRYVEVINCNLYGGCSTYSSLQDSKDTAIYGCLVHDSCFRAHGTSNFYLHNSRDSTKVVEHCIAYRSSGQNLAIHVYGGDDAYNMKFLENILFLGGIQGGKKDFDNLFINPGTPASGIEIIGNVASQFDTEAGRPNARFSSKSAAEKFDYTNADAIIRDNWFMGGLCAVSMGRWKQMVFEGNMLWAQKILIEINSATYRDGIHPQEKKPDLAGYRMSKNHYFAPPETLCFRYDRTAKIEEGDPLLSFAQWQALGIDKDSTLEKTTSGRPTGAMVRVFPNRYEKGRGNIAIFNWDALDSVEVDLSGVLPRGARYQVFNCLEVRQTLAMAKPVLAGVYEGKKLAFPMKKDSTSPSFDAFVVLPR